MNKKAESAISDEIMKNVMGFIIIAVFVLGIGLVVHRAWNGAAIWEEYYIAEISKVINGAQAGDEVTLDVHKATEIAKRNGLSTFSEIFTFDNLNKEACVKLSLGKKTCYFYFNDVDVIDQKLELGVPGNVLHFKIVNSQKEGK